MEDVIHRVDCGRGSLSFSSLSYSFCSYVFGAIGLDCLYTYTSVYFISIVIKFSSIACHITPSTRALSILTFHLLSLFGRPQESSWHYDPYLFCSGRERCATAQGTLQLLSGTEFRYLGIIITYSEYKYILGTRVVLPSFSPSFSLAPLRQTSLSENGRWL